MLRYRILSSEALCTRLLWLFLNSYVLKQTTLFGSRRKLEMTICKLLSAGCKMCERCGISLGFIEKLKLNLIAGFNFSEVASEGV